MPVTAPPGPSRRKGAPWVLVVVLAVLCLGLAGVAAYGLLLSGDRVSTEAIDLPAEVAGLKQAKQNEGGDIDFDATVEQYADVYGASVALASYRAEEGEEPGSPNPAMGPDQANVIVVRKELDYEVFPVFKPESATRYDREESGDLQCWTATYQDGDPQPEVCTKIADGLTVQVYGNRLETMKQLAEEIHSQLS